MRTGRIAAITSFDGPSSFEELIESERLRVVFRHWNDMRGNRFMPARSDIDPLCLGRALSIVWLYERGDDGEFRCRLAGEEINTALNQSIKKLTVREAYGDALGKPIRQRMNVVLETPAILHVSKVLETESRSVARICLPLCDENGDPKFTFGASEYVDPNRVLDRDPLLVGRVEDLALFKLPGFERIPADGLP